MRALQHTVGLIIQCATVAALGYYLLLLRMEVAVFSTISPVAKPVKYDESAPCCSPEVVGAEGVNLGRKGESCSGPAVFVVVGVPLCKHRDKGSFVLVIDEVIENRGVVIVGRAQVPLLEWGDLIQDVFQLQRVLDNKRKTKEK